MRKTEQIFVTSSRDRGTTTLANFSQHVERTQDGSAGPSVLPGSFGDAACGHCTPECETYRITDSNSVIDSASIVWGTLSGSQIVSAAGQSAAITVQATCTRVDANTFTLPSAAEWVVDVWFDDLHADPDYHYTAVPPNYILTVASLPTDMKVQAVYFNKAV